MAISRVVIIGLVGVLVCSLLLEAANATGIGYGPIEGGDPSKNCPKGNCPPGPPANGYRRGCEKGKQCRETPPSKTNAYKDSKDKEDQEAYQDAKVIKDDSVDPQFIEQNMVVLGH